MCCTPRSKPCLSKRKDHAEEEKGANKMAEEQETKDQASAEEGQAAAATSATGDEGAAHASAY